MNDKRVTIYDIAKELGISTATVNRAMTGKNKVSEETRKKVFETAKRMGFRPNTLARSLARKQIRLAVVAFTSFPEFHTPLIDGAKEAQRELIDYNIQVDYFSFCQGASNTEQGAAFLNRTLDTVASNGYDGLLICAKQVDAFEKLKEKKICVVTAVNDVEPAYRKFCIRYNGRVAGKMAAELLYRLGDHKRPVAVATGSLDVTSIHFQILEGFTEQLKTTPLQLVEAYRHHDDPSVAYEKTKAILRKYGNLGGIYVDSFNSLGVVQAVKEMGRAKDMCIITSDLYAELKTFILEGTVSASIFQNQYEQGRQGLRYLYQTIAEDLRLPSEVILPPQIILRSNLELF